MKKITKLRDMVNRAFTYNPNVMNEIAIIVAIGALIFAAVSGVFYYEDLHDGQ